MVFGRGQRPGTGMPEYCLHFPSSEGFTMDEEQKIKTGTRRLSGFALGGVHWVTDERWIYRAEHVALNDTALAAALRGEPWDYDPTQPEPAFGSLIKPLADGRQDKIREMLKPPEGLVEFRHAQVTIGPIWESRSELFMSDAGGVRWINPEFLCPKLENLSYRGLLECDTDNDRRLFLYGPGQEYLHGVVMPISDPLPFFGPTEAAVDVLQAVWEKGNG